MYTQYSVMDLLLAQPVIDVGLSLVHKAASTGNTASDEYDYLVGSNKTYMLIVFEELILAAA